MTETELAAWRAKIKVRSEALDREVAERLKEVSEAKAEEEQLAKTNRVEWILRLLLKHKFQRAIGIPSDFEAEYGKAADRNDLAFFQSVSKAQEQILGGDARNHKLILKTMLEAFGDLCAERHQRFLVEAEAECDRKLAQLAKYNPLAYKQLQAFARYSPQINIKAVLNRTAPVPAILREHLAFLNQPNIHRQRYGLPTKQSTGSLSRVLDRQIGTRQTGPVDSLQRPCAVFGLLAGGPRMSGPSPGKERPPMPAKESRAKADSGHSIADAARSANSNGGQNPSGLVRTRHCLQPINLRDFKARAAITWTKAPMLLAVQRIIETNQNYWPLSDRQIHYQLLNPPPLRNAGKADSTYRNDRNSYNDLCDLLTRARLVELIAWDAIADGTRPTQAERGFANLGRFIDRELALFLRGYRRNLLASQPNYIELVGEKKTFRASSRRWPIATVCLTQSAEVIVQLIHATD